MNKTCEKCIHHDVCRYPLEYRANPETCKRYEEQRPHGEWVLDKENSFVFDMYKCSKCGFGGSKRWHFCPNCGYPMISSNSEIEKSKSEIVPDYRDGWRLKGGDPK